MALDGNWGLFGLQGETLFIPAYYTIEGLRRYRGGGWDLLGCSLL